MSFFIAGVVSSSLFPAFDASASTVTVSYRDTGYFVTVDAPDTVNLSVDATPTGQTVVSSASTVNVVTNAPNGYKLYLSTSDSDLTSSGISQTFGPTAAGNSISLNSWGFSTTAGENKTWSPVPEVLPTGNYTEAGLIASGATKISELSTSNYPSGTNVDVYYGVNADTSMPSGTYSTTVYYTAFAEGIPQSAPSMQDFTITDCRNLNAEETIQLTDIRDGNVYNVAKLKDGNCWMQQNLALDGDRVLTPQDSNVTTSIALPANITAGTTSVNTAMQIINNQSGYDGNLYNWCAATVSGNCSAITTEQTSSVCPKGWQLPSNTGNSSYSNLFGFYGLPNTNTYGNYVSSVEASPLFYTAAGMYGDIFYEGEGRYWSSTAIGAGAAYRFHYNTSGFGPQGVGNTSNSWSVRCVMADTDTRTLTGLTYMQDMTTKICANSAENESKSLRDNRDANSYRVTKLKDGNCWMTQNLKLAGPKTLHPSDSNVTVDVDIPAAASSGTSVDTEMQIWNEYSSYDGKYYNWYAAVTISDCSSTTTEPTTSICPAGFRLPSSEGYHSFSYLFGKYGLPTTNTTGSSYYSTVEAAPLYFTRAGYYNSSYIGQNGGGYYWSRIPYNSTYTRHFDYSPSDFYPQSYIMKYYGLSVRCLSN